MDKRIILSLDVQSGQALKHFVCMLASKQDLLQTALDWPGPLVNRHWADTLVSEEIQALEDFHDHWSADATPGIRFDWDGPSMDLTLEALTPEQHEAWGQLVERIWAKAKTVRWALTRRTSVDNPKYSLRTWLLRLGMQGDAFSDTRRTLVSPLPGNAAFRRSR